MLTELEAVELLELKEKCLDSYGKPRTDVTADTEDLVRLAELQEKEEAEEGHDVVPIDELEVPELKEIAKKLSVKGYANMKKESLISAIEASQENVKPEEGNSTYIKSLEAEGYEYLGKNERGQYFIGPDKKAYVSNNSGAMSSVGNKFGEKLLKSLKR